MKLLAFILVVMFLVSCGKSPDPTIQDPQPVDPPSTNSPEQKSVLSTTTTCSMKTPEGDDLKYTITVFADGTASSDCQSNQDVGTSSNSSITKDPYYCRTPSQIGEKEEGWIFDWQFQSSYPKYSPMNVGEKTNVVLVAINYVPYDTAHVMDNCTQTTEYK